MRARGLQQQMTWPRMGALPQLASLMRLFDAPVPAAPVGADTGAVLQEMLGMTPEDIAALQQQGIV